MLETKGKKRVTDNLTERHSKNGCVNVCMHTISIYICVYVCLPVHFVSVCVFDEGSTIPVVLLQDSVRQAPSI